MAPSRSSSLSSDSRQVDRHPLSPFSMAINKMSESTDDLKTKESITTLGVGIFDEQDLV